MGAGGRLNPQGLTWDALAGRLRAIGPEVTPETIAASAGLIAPLHPREVPSDVAVQSDLAYGPHARHRLDVFSPVEGTARSAVVFVHGGAFVSGEKHRPGTPFHDNVGIWAARAGRLGITINHRLAPDDPWPAGAEDLLQVLDWCASEATEPDGRPLPVHLVGTSSGAVHAATFLAGGPGWDPERRLPASAAFVSGVFDLPSFGWERLRAYFGENPGQLHRWRLAERLSAVAPPLFFAVGELDTPDAHAQFLRMLEVYQGERGQLPAIARARAANHFTIVNAIGSAFDDLGPTLEAFHDAVDEGERP